MFKTKINSCDGIYSDSLDVRFTKACDNMCGFCIERRGANSFESNLDKMIEATIASGKKEVLILGGEPFLNPFELHYYVSNIRDHVEKVFITTSLPKTLNVNSKVVKDTLDLIDGLNCSVHHYDYKKNNKLLIAKSKHDRISQLEKIVEYCGEKVRVQMNLVVGVIDTEEELKEFINKMYDIGVRNLKINELQNSTLHYVSYKAITGKKMLAPYSHGCQTNDNFRDMNLIIKRSCFLTEKSILPTEDELEKLEVHTGPKTTVLYENGKLSEGWIRHEHPRDPEEYIMPLYERETISYTSMDSCHGRSSGRSCH